MAGRGLSLQYSAETVMVWVPYLKAGSFGGEAVILSLDGWNQYLLNPLPNWKFPGMLPEANLPYLSSIILEKKRGTQLYDFFLEPIFPELILLCICTQKYISLIVLNIIDFFCGIIFRYMSINKIEGITVTSPIIRFIYLFIISYPTLMDWIFWKALQIKQTKPWFIFII